MTVGLILAALLGGGVVGYGMGVRKTRAYHARWTEINTPIPGSHSGKGLRLKRVRVTR